MIMIYVRIRKYSVLLGVMTFSYFVSLLIEPTMKNQVLDADRKVDDSNVKIKNLHKSSDSSFAEHCTRDYSTFTLCHSGHKYPKQVQTWRDKNLTCSPERKIIEKTK